MVLHHIPAPPKVLVVEDEMMLRMSVPAGSIDIAWNIDEGKQRLQMTWSEKGGPSVIAHP